MSFCRVRGGSTRTRSPCRSHRLHSPCNGAYLFLCRCQSSNKSPLSFDSCFKSNLIHCINTIKQMLIKIVLNINMIIVSSIYWLRLIVRLRPFLRFDWRKRFLRTRSPLRFPIPLGRTHATSFSVPRWIS